MKAAQHEAERAKRAAEVPVLAYKAREDFVTAAAEEVALGEATAVAVKKANLEMTEQEMEDDTEVDTSINMKIKQKLKAREEAKLEEIHESDQEMEANE